MKVDVEQMRAEIRRINESSGLSLNGKRWASSISASIARVVMKCTIGMHQAVEDGNPIAPSADETEKIMDTALALYIAAYQVKDQLPASEKR